MEGAGQWRLPMHASARLLIAIAGFAVGLPTLADQPPAPAAVGGHPTPDSLNQPAPVVNPSPFADRGTPPPPPIPTQAPTASPLAAGPFVNFESPPVKPMAINGAGTRMYIANTPSGRIAVYDTTPAVAPAPQRLSLIREIPVGLDPVSVAIQPGTGERMLWVVNHLSDDVSVIDTNTNVVTKVVPVGDEPVNIAFSPDGLYAWVILQGLEESATPPFEHESSLVVIDTNAGQVIGSLRLEMNSARACGVDPSRRKLVVAALKSGNNTALAGKVIRRLLPNSNLTELINTVHAIEDFGPVAHLFSQPNLLAPFPDPTAAAIASPLVGRIVPDSQKDSEWAQVVDIIADPLDPTMPDPAMVSAYAAQHQIPTNSALLVLWEVMHDVQDTVDHDLAVIDVSNPRAPVVEMYIGDVGTTITGLAVDEVRGRVVVTNMEARNTTRLKTALRGHFIDHELVFVDDYAGTTPSITRVNLHADVPGFDDVTGPNHAAQAASLANPVDVAYWGPRDLLFVAALGTGRVGVVDADTGRVLGRAETGRGARAVTIDSANGRAFALNRTDHTMVQFGPLNSAAPTVAARQALFNPEPKAVKEGRDFLYSTKFSNNFGSSCAMCHIDADLDGLDWDLGDSTDPMLQPGPANVCASPCLPNHPVKGPMFTQSLRGLSDHNPFHWRGDKPQFTDFAEAFQGLLGGASPLDDAAMSKFDAFIKTVVYSPNPFWNRDNSTKDPRAFPNGAIAYLDSSNQFVAPHCNQCHQVTHDGALDLGLSDGGFDLSGLLDQIQEVPHLRGLYRKTGGNKYTGFGLMHDGRSEPNDFPTFQPDTLGAFLRTFFAFPTDSANGNDNNFQEVKAFVTAFPSNVTNVVGWQVRTRGTATAQQMADIMTMINQSIPPADPNVPLAQHKRCDTIAQGLIGGQMRGYVYDSASGTATPMFRSDRNEILSLQALLSQAGTGTLVFMAAPPDSGIRLAIDADLDCDPNGHDPFPYSNADVDQSGAVGPQDLFEFLATFFSGLPGGDFNHSGTVTSQDIFDFLAEFFKPQCPPLPSPLPPVQPGP